MAFDWGQLGNTLYPNASKSFLNLFGIKLPALKETQFFSSKEEGTTDPLGTDYSQDFLNNTEGILRNDSPENAASPTIQRVDATEATNKTAVPYTDGKAKLTKKPNKNVYSLNGNGTFDRTQSMFGLASAADNGNKAGDISHLEYSLVAGQKGLTPEQLTQMFGDNRIGRKVAASYDPETGNFNLGGLGTRSVKRLRNGLTNLFNSKTDEDIVRQSIQINNDPAVKSVVDEAMNPDYYKLMANQLVPDLVDAPIEEEEANEYTGPSGEEALAAQLLRRDAAAKEQRYAGYDLAANDFYNGLSEKQQAALDWKGSDGTIDRNKIKAWQKRNHLLADGLFGKNSQQFANDWAGTASLIEQMKSNLNSELSVEPSSEGTLTIGFGNKLVSVLTNPPGEQAPTKPKPAADQGRYALNTSTMYLGEDGKLYKKEGSGYTFNKLGGKLKFMQEGGNVVLQRLRGVSPQQKTSYSQFENLLNQYGSDGELSRQDRRAMRKDLGLSRSAMRRIGKSFNKGGLGAFLNYVKGLEKNSYIKDGKLYTQGQDGYLDEDFNAATRKGTDATALVNQYNQDVMNWRKGDLSYSGGKYKMGGFEGGPDVEFDENDLPDWLKNDTERLRAAQQQSYFNAVNDYNNLDILNQYSNENLAKTLGLDVSGYDAYNDEDKLKFRKDATRALFEHLDGMRNSQDGTFNFDGNVQADAIMKSLINNQSTSALPWLGKLGWSSGGTYGLMLQGQKRKGAYGLLAKEGAVMNYIRKHADGGKSGNNRVGVNRNFSRAGWFGQERFSPDENMFGWNEEYLNGHYRYSTPDPNVTLFVNKNNGNVFLQDLDEYGQYKLGQNIGNVSGPITDDGLYEVYMKHFTKNPTIAAPSNRTAQAEPEKEPEKKPNPGPNKLEEKPEYKAYKSRYSDDYNSKHYYATYKNGGLLNMNKINYFLDGGAVAPLAAPAAAPAQGGQDMLAQVEQLVQAAMSGDPQATDTIQKIMAAAQQGDQLAAQIAQMILEIAQQMQGTPAAKYGAKLSYLKSLKSGCPDGYEVSFHKAGGRLCKECVKKAAGGAQIGTGQQQRNLVRHGSFNNSAFGSGDAATAKVKWLQNQMFANGMNGRSTNDNRVDGKWGAQSLALAQKQGWTIGAGGDTLMRGDKIYNWDANRNEYVEDAGNPSNTPKRGAEDELWYILSDGRQREAQNWINRQNAAGKQAGIADWFAMNEGNHHSLENAIKAGQIQADFVKDLMMGVAGTEALGALSKTAGPLLSKALGTAGRTVGKGVSAANDAIEETVYALSNPSQAATRVRTAVGNATNRARSAASNAGNAAKGAALRAGNTVRTAAGNAAGAVRGAGTRAANNITSGWRNVMNKAADAVTPKVTPFEMAPQGGEMYNGLEFIAPFKKGGNLKKKLCGGKKLQEGAKVTEEKCGGKAKKKCLNGGTLTLEALQTAYKSLNA